MPEATEPRFREGDRVTVHEDYLNTHHRTPGYVKGKRGRIAALSGMFPNPESGAYGGTGLPRRALYRVEFDQTELWGDRYADPRSDTLLVDIFEHWLEPG